MTIQQVQAQRERIRRAAGLLALEHGVVGSTPPGLTVKGHAESIYQEGITQAENTAATGAMSWVTAAELIASTYEQLVDDMQKAGKP
ncbi:MULTISPECIES: hypothetical protein [unclassified Brevibacterium]|uniref:hypothetical protein n=1 Tax=unclassified Brevibacterium TaxID=2614124 RepID=UPI001E42E0A2|nr:MULTISPECIES: hypothetical protein [unclassified Brevibacterium]MCD1287325.1 hypothetical protein [Brevibacterium sp. CCUG 69071]MDK8436420.1 hypothetical protein [Brevibacterium sp. H-BE7]